MTLSPDLAAHHAICHTSFWRPLPDGSEHPMFYRRLVEDEVRDLIETGGFTLPSDLIPESVRRWRSLTVAATDVIQPEPIDLLGALKDSIDRARARS